MNHFGGTFTNLAVRAQKRSDGLITHMGYHINQCFDKLLSTERRTEEKESNNVITMVVLLLYVSACNDIVTPS